MSTALANIDSSKFEKTISRLKGEAQIIVVDSPEKCLQAKTMQRDVRNYIKDAKSALDPFVNMTKRAYDDAKDERARWVDPAQLIDDALAGKVKTFERQEREAAERETQRINEANAKAAREAAEEARRVIREGVESDRRRQVAEINAALKAGDIGKRQAAKMLKDIGAVAEAAVQQAEADAEAAKNAPVPQVTVRPNIPTVSGVPSRRNWKFRIPDPDKVPREWCCPDEVKIGQAVRSWKKSGDVIQGVVAYEE